VTPPTPAYSWSFSAFPRNKETLMKIKIDGTWSYLNSEKDVKERCRVNKINWAGPGWYYTATYSQRCPRGCCYDDVLDIEPASERVAELEEAIRELNDELETAKQKEQNHV
jgi:hypothetical protein